MKVYQDAFGKGDVHAAAAEATLIALATLVLSFGFLRAANRRNKQEAAR
jgi:multiple sugar transport system permease protein